MDPTLALIMANMANVKQNTLIYDPFVGTGMGILHKQYEIKSTSAAISFTFYLHCKAIIAALFFILTSYLRIFAQV